jgi:hypothetical protein
MPRKIWFTLHLFFADARKSIFNRTRPFNFHFKMKRTLRILPLLVLFGLTVQIGLAQETNRAHAPSLLSQSEITVVMYSK